jgi:UDP-hydrolysing UDP-N-acetyl-D-glucosamine 2-epimerase
MADARKICILTGTRADYGLLRRLVLEVDASTDVELQLVVTGSHLLDGFGGTRDEIARDGISAAAEVLIWTGGDTPVEVGAQYGDAVGAFSRVLAELSPDVVVILGDRLEAFAMATAATIMTVPIVHIHGGEVTEGAMDDSLRHAITKLAHLHLTSTEGHRQRVIQLGEDPARVFNLGAPIVDALSELTLLGQDELAAAFDIRFGERTALVTFHPAGMDVLPPRELVAELLGALRDLPRLHVIITGTNSDIGSAEVREAISSFVAENRDRVDYVESFGQIGYLSTMALCDVVVGNSSSAVLEAPVLGIPSVLIGDRQAGRPLSPSVVSPNPDRVSIAAAIERAISSDFRESVADAELPFGEPGFSSRALELIVAQHFPRPPRKKFWDIDAGKKRT